MDFRIVSIRENPGFGDNRALKIELQGVVKDFGVQACLTAYVPDSGEFHGLTIGQILRFGDLPPVYQVSPTLDNPTGWRIGEKIETTFVPQRPAAYDPTKPEREEPEDWARPKGVAFDPTREGHWKSPEVRTKVDEAYQDLGKLGPVIDPRITSLKYGHFTGDPDPAWNGRFTTSGTGTGYQTDTGLPPSGLASEAFAPNERAAEQAVISKDIHDAVAKNEKWPIEEAKFRDGFVRKKGVIGRKP